MDPVEPFKIIPLSWRFLKQHRKELTLVAMFLMGIPLIIQAFDPVPIFIEGSEGILHSFQQIGLALEEFEHGHWIYIITDTRVTLGSLLLPSFIYYYLFLHEQGKFTNLQNTVHTFISLFPILISTVFLWFFGLILRSLLLVIPGIIYSVYWIFATQSILYYRPQPFNTFELQRNYIIRKRLYFKHYAEGALKTSKAIVQDRWRDTVGTVFVYSLFVGGLSFLIGLIPLVSYIVWGGWNILGDLITNLLQIPLVLLSALIYGFLFISWKQTYEAKIAKQQTESTPQSAVKNKL